MKVLLTGAYGRVGTAVLDHHRGTHEYLPFDTREHPYLETTVGDISSYDTIEQATRERDAVVHLAGDSNVNADWNSILQNNIIGGFNCFKACRINEISTVVVASSNHVVGMYETEHAPDLYEPDHDLTLDHRMPVRPDSRYGVSKAFLEALGRYYVENYEYPKQVYMIRFGSVRFPAHNHPYGDAEAGVAEGEWDRHSKQYENAVQRMKATWHSRHDAATLIECCLADQSVTFDVFYGVSDNERRWFDLDHARAVLGYDPQDSAKDFDGPPSDLGHDDTTAFDL